MNQVSTTTLETARKEINKVLRRHRLNWQDVAPDTDVGIWKKVSPVSRRVRIELWRKAAGILKNRKMPDPVKWQRKIRKEWERKSP